MVANWPVTRRRHWVDLLTARAIENQAYVVGVNRVGEGDGLAYAGDSRILDPLGETLASAAGGESMLLADVDAGPGQAGPEGLAVSGGSAAGGLSARTASTRSSAGGRTR